MIVLDPPQLLCTCVKVIAVSPFRVVDEVVRKLYKKCLSIIFEV